MTAALKTQPDDQPARFLIGIDLGTTNSAIAFVDSTLTTWEVRDFSVPQLVSPGEVDARGTLPSFHYEAAPGELPAAALRLPWATADEQPSTAVGIFARDHGAAVPGRLVVSAKSWLSHSGVDRTAALLPWHAAADVHKLSPVEVSARYLGHLRAAWDYAHPQHPMAAQDVVLTVPASFDEVARELTIQAARQAGLARVVLVEEPQAAFYDWIHAQGVQWDQKVKPGQTILVCDVGGGTTDFTLIRVRPAGSGKVLFHRVAVGEHLILGGDNLDLALAHHVEKKLAGDGKLPPHQWGPLVRICRVAKETLLGPNPPATYTLSLPGSGSKLIGGSVRAELTLDEMRQVLVEGFLPKVPLDARPAARRSGFQEFGLPYASDAAITRYLAAFLTAHRDTTEQPDAPAAKPDMVLFNGGLFESPVLRERLLEVLAGWFDAPPVVLQNDRLDLAVARGAAYYGMVRRGKGVRITGGLAHSYYVGVQTGKNPEDLSALCLLPAGVEEGQEIDLRDRTFDLLIRQPAEFPLYYSATRTTDKPGQLAPVDPEQLTALPPIRTVLQSGRKSEADTVAVHLHARLTEIGTLEMWCGEARGDRRWKLEFDVRSATRTDAGRHDGAAETQGFVEENIVAACRQIIRGAFVKPAGGATHPPAGVVKQLEQATGMSRHDWPSSLMRSFWEALLEVEPGRKISWEHEARWLGLAGFCLRPGYGLAVDDWRVTQTWKLYAGALQFPKNEQCRAEWWILWRRVAGGLSAGQQATLAEPLLADWRLWSRKSGSGVKGRSPTFQFGPHETAEVWRLLGSLELLKPETKLELGNLLIDRLTREKVSAIRDALLFAIGRVGGRVPVYGPLNVLVDASVAEGWTRRLVQINPTDDKAPFAAVLLARKTGDRYRDLSDGIRTEAITWLQHRAASPHLIELVREGGTLAAEEQRTAFGESLPRGLRIE